MIYGLIASVLCLSWFLHRTMEKVMLLEEDMAKVRNWLSMDAQRPDVEKAG